MTFQVLTELPVSGPYSAQQDHPISGSNVHFAYPTNTANHYYEQRSIGDLLIAPHTSRVWPWGRTETHIGNVVPYDSIQGTGESYTGAGVSGDNYAVRNGITAENAPRYVVLNIEQWASYVGQDLVGPPEAPRFPWTGISSAIEADVQTANTRFVEARLAMGSVMPAGVKVGVWNNFQFGPLDNHLRTSFSSSGAQEEALRANAALIAPRLAADSMLITANYFGNMGNVIGQMNLIDKISRLAHELYGDKEHFLFFWPYPATEPDTVQPINRVAVRKCIEYCQYLYERRGYPAGCGIWQAQPVASNLGRAWVDEGWVIELEDWQSRGRIYDTQIPLELR